MSDIQYLSALAEKQHPGENGVIALNWFNGNRNPLTDYALSGAFIGMTLKTRPEDLFRALVEANAFGTRLIIENFEKTGIKVDRMTAAGGITFKSPFVMQTISNVLGKELCGASYLHSGSLASAIYASVAAGSAAKSSTTAINMDLSCSFIAIFFSARLFCSSLLGCYGIVEQVFRSL